jgi:hypothetical protein
LKSSPSGSRWSPGHVPISLPPAILCGRGLREKVSKCLTYLSRIEQMLGGQADLLTVAGEEERNSILFAGCSHLTACGSVEMTAAAPCTWTADHAPHAAQMSSDCMMPTVCKMNADCS